MLLPRAKLPLSSLDIVSSARALGQSRLFETHVKILELEERMGSQPMVLIARFDDSRTLCAVERESRGLYALCQLGSWVNFQGLKAEAVVSKQDVQKMSETGFLGSAITQAAVPLAEVVRHHPLLVAEAWLVLVRLETLGSRWQEKSKDASPWIE